MDYNKIIEELEESSQGYFGDGGFEAERLGRLKQIAELKIAEKALEESKKANRRMFVIAIVTAIISGLVSLLQIILSII